VSWGSTAGEGRSEVAFVPRTVARGGTMSAVRTGRPASGSLGATIVNRGPPAEDLVIRASTTADLPSSASRDNSVPPGGLEPPSPGLGALPAASTPASMPDFDVILDYTSDNQNHCPPRFHSTSHSTKPDPGPVRRQGRARNGAATDRRLRVRLPPPSRRHYARCLPPRTTNRGSETRSSWD